MSSYANCPVPQAGEEVVAFSPFVFENELNPIYFRQHLPAAELMEVECTSEESLHNDLPEDSEEPLEPTTPAPQDAPTPPTPSSAASPTWSPSAASTPASWPSPTSEPSSTSTSPPTSPASQTSYTCADCDESFRLRGELNRHRNRKHIKRFRCSTPGCDAAFHLKTDLGRHQQSMRCGAEDAVRLCCEYDGCAKTFSRKDNLDRHVWEKHQHGSRKGKR